LLTLELVRLRRRATRFLIRNCLSYVAFGSITDDIKVS
jgi:hypothetical protein